MQNKNNLSWRNRAQPRKAIWFSIWKFAQVTQHINRKEMLSGEGPVSEEAEVRALAEPGAGTSGDNGATDFKTGRKSSSESRDLHPQRSEAERHDHCSHQPEGLSETLLQNHRGEKLNKLKFFGLFSTLPIAITQE